MEIRTNNISKIDTKKVAVLGAAGGIGQPLSLLLKLCPYVSELACYDIKGTPGIAADLSHIPTRATVTGSLPLENDNNEGLRNTLTGCDVVVISAGVPRKPGMTRDDLFSINARIVQTLVEGCADFCPNAMIAIITNPVNSTVPAAAQVLKSKGVYNPTKLAGITTLDVIRANTFIADHIKKTKEDSSNTNINVTVIGGHAGITILPLFSQVEGLVLSDEEREALTVRTQFGGDEVVKAKAGAGSATLSMAYAGYLFTENVLKGLIGKKDIIQCAFVESSASLTNIPLPFFASPCKFGVNGIEEVLSYGPISPYEQSWLDKMIPVLQTQIQKGVDFVVEGGK